MNEEAIINFEIMRALWPSEQVIVRDQKPIQELLCRFHDLVANILSDQQKHDDALVHLEKALRFAQQLNKDDLKVAVLYDYGLTLWRACLPTLGIDEALALPGLPEEEQPGVYVRRYAGKEVADGQLLSSFLTKIAQLPVSQRQATWTYGLCLAMILAPSSHTKHFHEKCCLQWRCSLDLRKQIG